MKKRFTSQVHRGGKTIKLTYKQTQVYQAVQRYTKDMLQSVKTVGKEPFVRRDGQVEVDAKWGGGTFPTVEAAYESIALFLFYPKQFEELRSLGA